MPTPDKVLVTNWIALRSKYGRDGVTRIKSALDRLVRADAVRGVTTRIVAIDDGRTARTLGIKAVSDPTDAKSAKLAVDAIDALWNPHYFVLVGSDDVIPTQPLKNPLYQPGPTALDSDLLVPSDLPYASDYEFTTQIAHYRGATRVVGRIADGHGSKSTAQLRKALRVAAGAVARPRKHYERPWVLTAADWNQSTRQTLDRVYGPGTEFMEVPPAEKWRLGDTRRLMHIFNCHGVDSAPQLQGQKGWFRPIAMNSDVLLMPGRLSEGTVVASECCYTGQMMAPDPKRGLAWVDTYLRAGAYGFLGSSTEVWGGITTNQDADYLVRYFLLHVLAGYSTGAALLQARQDYVSHKTVLSPTDLKTLAQFALFGDPSLHPVASQRTDGPGGPTRGLAVRRQRQRNLGAALHATTEHASEKPLSVAAVEHHRLIVEARHETGHKFGARTESMQFGIVAPGRSRVEPGRAFVAIHETSRRGTHLALLRTEQGAIDEVRLLQRR